ncbi:MAG TPA: hypothetical protein VGL04_05940 [Sporichthyaceae bacterium]
MMIDPNGHDKFVLRQKFTLGINRYYFSIPDGASDGEPFCFVEQKRFKFKEDIGFFADESKTEQLMRIQARQRFDPKARYDITTAAGLPIGQIQKVFGASLLRSTYALFTPDGQEICRATERSMAVALFRRLIGFIPYVDDIAAWLPIPYDFNFIRNDQVIATNRRRRFKLMDVYDIDASADTERVLDRRLLLATSVGMDALQAR